jgi:hypothetical protein
MPCGRLFGKRALLLKEFWRKVKDTLYVLENIHTDSFGILISDACHGFDDSRNGTRVVPSSPIRGGSYVWGICLRNEVRKWGETDDIIIVMGKGEDGRV